MVESNQNRAYIIDDKTSKKLAPRYLKGMIDLGFRYTRDLARLHARDQQLNVFCPLRLEIVAPWLIVLRDKIVLRDSEPCCAAQEQEGKNANIVRDWPDEYFQLFSFV